MNAANARWAARVLVALISTFAGAASIEAQSGVSLGSEENILHLFDDSGRLAVDFNVDGVNTPQSIEIGRADLTGELESDIDVVLNDSNSTLAVYDRSIQLDASAADMILGSGSVAQPGSPGTLAIRDGTGFLATQIDGSTGDIVQVVDNSGSTGLDFDGNGAVKAWAIINDQGDVIRCWNCNPATDQTRLISVGYYEVDFTFGDVNNRPVLVSSSCPTADDLSEGLQCAWTAYLSVAPRLNDASSFHVRARQPDESSPGYVNFLSGFTIVVF